MKKNLSYSAWNTIITYAFSFLTLMYVSRMLRPEVLGRISFAESVISYFVLLAGLGIPMYGLRECSANREDPERLSAIVREMLVLGILFSIISMALLAVSCIVSPKLRQEYLILAVLGAQILFQAFGCEWLYKSLELFKVIAIRNFLVKAGMFVLCLLLVKTEADGLKYVILLSGGILAVNLYNLVGMGKYVRLRGKVDSAALLSHIRPMLVFFVMACATTIYYNMDLVMLGFMDTDSMVGGYGVVTKIKAVLVVVSGLVWSTALPRATAYWVENKTEEFEKLARTSMRLVLLIQIPMTVVTLFVANLMIYIVAGGEYIFAAGALKILALSIVPIAVSNIIGGLILIPAKKEKALLFAELAGALANLILNFILIPKYSIYGAAATTVLAEVIVALVTWYVARFKMHIRFCSVSHNYHKLNRK